MGLFAGILSSDWKEIKRHNNFAIKYLPVKWYYDSKSRRNDKYHRQEDQQFTDAINTVSIEQEPIFILGHWRSGTTMLHNTLCADEQFAFPNLVETYNPHTFLTLLPELEQDKKNQRSMKRPMDNVYVNYKSPAEDEFALSLLSLCSPILGWAFPQRRDYYDQFLLLDDVTADELDRWSWALTYLAKKLTFKYNKQLVLKSPQHTARVGKILKIFPNAKFIHFRRNPYDVYKSTLNLYTNTVQSLAFQNIPGDNLDDYIIKMYKTMYQRFEDEMSLIPESNIVELTYEDFIDDSDAGLKFIYNSLDLKGVDGLIDFFKEQQPKKSNYKRNSYEQLNVSAKQKINREWEQFFHKWNYTLT
jgi:hypothetical protein